MQDCHKPGGHSCGKPQAQPQPGAPGHHMLPLGLCHDLFIWDLLCQDPFLTGRGSGFSNSRKGHNESAAEGN